MTDETEAYSERRSEAGSFQSDLTVSKAIDRRGPIRWLIVCGAVLIAGIAIGTAVMVNNSRERALTGSGRELENTVLLLVRHFDQQLEELDATQKDIIKQMQLAGIASSDEFKKWMSSEDIHKMLQSKMNALSYVGAPSVFDSDGQLVASASAWPAARFNIADREYFKSLKADPYRSTISSAPVISNVTGAVIIPLVRRINGPNGEFLGVISRGIEPYYFSKFFASLALQEGASISMVHRSGVLLARYPQINGAVGQNFATTTVDNVLENSDHGMVRLMSPVDGKDRLVAFRTLTNYPVRVVATTTVSAVLESWRTQTRFLVLVATLSSIVVAAFILLIIRQMRDQGRSTQRRLMLEKQRLLTAVNHMTQGLLLLDATGHLVIGNQRYIDMYGLSAEALKEGQSIKNIITHRLERGSFAGNIEEYCEAVWRNKDKKSLSVVSTPDGRFIQIQHTPVSDGGWLVTHEDITERRLFDARIAHLAHYDALTDLPNRTLFREKLESELVDLKVNDKIAVLYIDIDEFKSINDSLGHPIGDELLKVISARLSSCIGPRDFVARLGGDEFAIVQVGIRDCDESTALVGRVYEEIRQSHDCLGHCLSTDASIGIAVAPDDGIDLDQLLKHADLAMYAAKAAGRRTYRFFEPDMNARMNARRALELDLREAINEGKLELHYQPSVCTQDNAIIGCEALVRWLHPQQGVISPVDFIPVAEQAGLIDQLGEWVLMTACREAATWPGQIKIAVNVSPIQFKTHTFPLKVASALAASGLPASRLEIEVTEAVLIDDDDVALVILHQLRDMGVRIALDDFGTGYSSLSYLQRFPFDKIKIDRCFVRDITEPDGSLSIVQAVVNIARSRHMTTTAEGVETQSQLDVLRNLGCNEMQGYLFSAAKTAEDIRKLFLSAPLAKQLPAA